PSSKLGARQGQRQNKGHGGARCDNKARHKALRRWRQGKYVTSWRTGRATLCQLSGARAPGTLLARRWDGWLWTLLGWLAIGVAKVLLEDSCGGRRLELLEAPCSCYVGDVSPTIAPIPPLME
ncbi:unnamed protein product, partial [Ilex paraguariensis]